MESSAVKVGSHTPPPQLPTKLSGPVCVCFDSTTTHNADICIMTAVAPALSIAWVRQILQTYFEIIPRDQKYLQTQTHTATSKLIQAQKNWFWQPLSNQHIHYKNHLLCPSWLTHHLWTFETQSQTYYIFGTTLFVSEVSCNFLFSLIIIIKTKKAAVFADDSGAGCERGYTGCW